MRMEPQAPGRREIRSVRWDLEVLQLSSMRTSWRKYGWPYEDKTLRGTRDRCFIWCSNSSRRRKRSACCSGLLKPPEQNCKPRTRTDPTLIGWITSSCWSLERTQARWTEDTASNNWTLFQYRSGRDLHPLNLTSARYAWKPLKWANGSKSWGVGMSTTQSVLIRGFRKRSVALFAACHH